MAKPKREPIELEITKAAFDGDGLASVSGKTCFVEGALPGEKVLARIFEEKKNYLKAKIIKVLQSSYARTEAPCPYYAYCGGCQYQHTAYSEELKLKEEQVWEILGRAAGIWNGFRPIVHSGKDYGYRNNVTLQVQSSGKRREIISLGFFGRDNVSIIPVKKCLLADERLLPVFGATLHFKKTPEKITFRLSEEGEIVSDEQERFLRIRVGDEILLTHSQGFFQNNLAVASVLAGKVKEWAALIHPKIFFDLYAGVGFFSVLCAPGIDKIFCVEESVASVKALRMNCQERKILQMQIFEGRVEKIFSGLWTQENNNRALVLLDPPRQGLSQTLAKFLSEQRNVAGLIYVSCDPATLARDLKIILDKAHFEVKEVVPFDMFPRTKHIEVAVFLTARPEVMRAL